jgi:hypothetical protein
MKKHLLLAACLSWAATQAQQIQRCSTHEYQQQILNDHPEYQAVVDEGNNYAQEYAQNHPEGFAPRATVVIPVVFHVVYANATENISTTRLLEQLQVLNEDYGKFNAYAGNVPAAFQSLHANTDIQFCLAHKDPDGNWTDGIERTQTTVSSFSTNDNVKFSATGGADAWPRDKYLNIWVCDLGSSLLGYAAFPGGPATRDGVVLHYRYTGKTGASAPFNKGRTATHEVGHWLGLYHIWGDDGSSCSGTDQVADTPNQAGENYGCFTVGQVRTDACSPNAPGIMWMNYMDYTDDACMYMFTTGQKTRMWSYLNNQRLQLQSSQQCLVGIEDQALAAKINLFPSPNDGNFSLQFNGLLLNDVTITITNSVGQIVEMRYYDIVHDTQLSFDMSQQPQGVYLIDITTSNERVIKKMIKQ